MTSTNSLPEDEWYVSGPGFITLSQIPSLSIHILELKTSNHHHSHSSKQLLEIGAPGPRLLVPMSDELMIMYKGWRPGSQGDCCDLSLFWLPQEGGWSCDDRRVRAGQLTQLHSEEGQKKDNQIYVVRVYKWGEHSWCYQSIANDTQRNNKKPRCSRCSSQCSWFSPSPCLSSLPQLLTQILKDLEIVCVSGYWLLFVDPMVAPMSTNVKQSVRVWGWTALQAVIVVPRT